MDHSITWRNPWTASGQPSLTLYFGGERLVGYQYGEYTGAVLHRAPSRGPLLATNRGLTFRDTLERGRKLYGSAFTLSSAQGGTWQVETRRGRLDGYAWGKPKYGDVSWQSVVATIDAGNVGCPAASP